MGLCGDQRKGTLPPTILLLLPSLLMLCEDEKLLIFLYI